jgi:hypothetical protein
MALGADRITVDDDNALITFTEHRGRNLGNGGFSGTRESGEPGDAAAHAILSFRLAKHAVVISYQLSVFSYQWFSVFSDSFRWCEENTENY